MEIKCTIERDRFGRPIYAPGDGVGIYGSGPVGLASEKLITPHTPLYHFLVIRRYIEDEDDYEIMESIGNFPIQLSWFKSHTVALGRLSWYAKDKYEVFRMNDPDYWNLGDLAVHKASAFGRRAYDYGQFVKLFTWAAGYFAKEIFTGHIPPRAVRPDQIPYKNDRDFTCIELYFAIWNLVGRRIRAHGQAPVPAEVILAERRGTLIHIDSHDGNVSKWRAPRGAINRYTPVIGAAAEDLKAGDNLALGTDGMVYKYRAIETNWAFLGTAAADISRDALVGVDSTGRLRETLVEPELRDGQIIAVSLTPKGVEELKKEWGKPPEHSPGIIGDARKREEAKFYDGGRFATYLCEVFDIDPTTVYRILVDAKVGDAARITCFQFARTSDGKIDGLKKFALSYEIQPRDRPKVVQFSGENPWDAVVHHEGLDIIEEEAFQKYVQMKLDVENKGRVLSLVSLDELETWFREWGRPTVSISGGIPEGMKVPEAVTTMAIHHIPPVSHDPGPDLIARPMGQERNRLHVYRQPFGYPIRLCDWVAEDVGEIQVVHYFAGREELGPIRATLNYEASAHGWNVCKLCLAITEGRRSSVGQAKPEGFNCRECGQYLETPLTRHTYEDCEAYKKNHGKGAEHGI